MVAGPQGHAVYLWVHGGGVQKDAHGGKSTCGVDGESKTNKTAIAVDSQWLATNRQANEISGSERRAFDAVELDRENWPSPPAHPADAICLPVPLTRS